MYGISKEHRQQKYDCLPFRPNLLVLQTHTYHFAKFLVPILNPSTINEYAVKNAFQFAEMICE